MDSAYQFSSNKLSINVFMPQMQFWVHMPKYGYSALFSLEISKIQK